MNKETNLTGPLLSYRSALQKDFGLEYPQYDFYFEDYLIQRLYDADVPALKDRKK